ncbi:MAG: SDR family NAD(P)-dependent oxidoreductase [Bacteroidia bacterium]|jgi:NAD(P)-dependent dehydrogenase (short-subunit alcohol dehydrogenase family)|nr:SDR family NAD(P)-dependent oxidoreductase [Bacteroidia bacterium]
MSKEIIITGANGGLGLWTTKFLLDNGYTVIMACRDVAKARKQVYEFGQFALAEKVKIVHLDLADFESIRKFVNECAPENNAYFGLICNAGLTYSGQTRFTQNGIEETFGVNYLGHFLLTNLLLSRFTIERVFMISSALHDPALKSPFAKAVFRPVNEMAFPAATASNAAQKTQEFYATSKLCQILHAYELDRRMNKDGVIRCRVNAYNPGFMALTNFGRTHKRFERLGRWIIYLIGRVAGFTVSAHKSAGLLVNHFTNSTVSRKYFDLNKMTKSSADSYDQQKARELWAGSEELVGQKFEY